MNLIWRSHIAGGVAAVAAVCLAWQAAQGYYGWPLLAGAAAFGVVLVTLLRVPLDAAAIGLLLFGYLVGNRGFAQLMPLARLPLLPAEMGLLIAGSWLLVRSALSQTLPFRRDALNWLVLGWILVGTARVIFDVRVFGFLALRDYAMIYYAAFFFIAQQLAREPGCRRFLIRVLLVACVAQPIAFALVEVFPEFVLTKMAVRGAPVIYFKGDLAATFLAVSAVVLFLIPRAVHRWWAWPLATAEFLYVVSGENRASMLGALAAFLWLALRKRAFPFVQGSVVATALLIVAALATLAENPWAERRLHGFTERVGSLVDFPGNRNYQSEESSMKGGNNQFRAMWWRAVIDETILRNPALGLGFGYDLARNFLQEYNPGMGDDFTARSPHSILVTTFGRMGLLGLGVFACFIGALFVRTWRIMRNLASPPVELSLWACVWVILVSACFGVVLEGPMGAVVFWTLLGLANASPRTEPDNTLPAPVAKQREPELARASAG